MGELEFEVRVGGLAFGAYDKLADALACMYRAKETYTSVDLFRRGILVRYARKQRNGKWVTA